jgi:hydrogenase maturation factor
LKVGEPCLSVRWETRSVLGIDPLDMASDGKLLFLVDSFVDNLVASFPQIKSELEGLADHST